MSNRVKTEGLTGPAMTERIALGLAIAEHHAQPGVPMSLEVLATFCGCTDSAITLIEQGALKKLRKRAAYDPVLREVLQEFLSPTERNHAHSTGEGSGKGPVPDPIPRGERRRW